MDQIIDFDIVELGVEGIELYINDCYQNNLGQTIAAPYCVRAKPHAQVSMPLEWKEVKRGLDPLEFTIFNAMDRIEKKGSFRASLKKRSQAERSNSKTWRAVQKLKRSSSL